MAYKVNWETLPSMPFNEKGVRQIFYGENVMIAKNVLNPGFPSFAHSHPQEQILLITEGMCEVKIGDEKFTMGPGDMVCVAPNIVHDIKVLGDRPAVNIDIFSPIREDFVEAMKKHGV